VPAGAFDRLAAGGHDLELPPVVRLRVGQTLAIRNDDRLTHIVLGEVVAPGQTVRRTLTQPGIAVYAAGCAAHAAGSGMTSLIVAPARLALGVTLGGLMLNDRIVPGDWIAWALPAHVHMLLVGWLLQFVLAIAFWLLPRRRLPARPLGSDERTARAAAVALNLGLAARLVAEPLARAGHDAAWIAATLAIAALLQVGAVLTFVAHLWPRLAPRKARPPTAATTPAAQ
jgi:hypothetical protein